MVSVQNIQDVNVSSAFALPPYFTEFKLLSARKRAQAFDRRRMAARPARAAKPVSDIAQDEGSGTAGKGAPDASSVIMTSPLPDWTAAARIWSRPASNEPPPAPPPWMAPPPPL